MIKKLNIILLLLFCMLSIHATEFSYNIQLNYNGEYQCDIMTDGINKTYDLKNYKVVKNSFEENVEIKCNKKLSSYKLKILHDDTVVKTTTNRYYDLKIKELQTNNLDNCNVNKDGLTEDLEGDQLFIDTFTITCNETKDKIEIYVYGDNYSFYDKVYNTTKYTYNKDSISKPYKIEILFRDDFNKNNKCILLLDNKQKVQKTFSKDMSTREHSLNSKVGNLVKLTCDKNIDHMYLFIDTFEYGKEYHSKEYTNISKLEINIKGLNITGNQVESSEPVIETIRIITPKKVKVDLSNKDLMSIISDNLYLFSILIFN